MISPSAAALAAFCTESIPPEDIQRLTTLQGEIHTNLRAANEELAAHNAFSAETHSRLASRFTQHAATLKSVHAKLLETFRRTRALRTRLLAAHPELAEAAAAADAAREAEIEQSRSVASSSEQPVEVEPSSQQPSEAEAAPSSPLASMSLLSTPSARRARIGLLHGGCSNSAIFRIQLKRFLAAAEALPLFDFVDLGGSLPTEEVRFDERGLANMRLMRKTFGEDQRLFEHAVTRYDDEGRFYYDRLDEGIAHLEATMRRRAPIDALIGFSQGANMATILSARACLKRDGAPPPFKALVLLENDPPAWHTKNVPELFTQPLQVPALLVGGSTESPKTEEVGRLYAEPQHLRHNEGHRPLPKEAERCEALVEGMVAFLRRHVE